MFGTLRLMGDVVADEHMDSSQSKLTAVPLFETFRWELPLRFALWITVAFLVTEAILVITTPTGETGNIIAAIMFAFYYFYIATPIVIGALAILIYNFAPRLICKKEINSKQHGIYGLLSLIASIVIVKVILASTAYTPLKGQVVELCVFGIALLIVLSASIYVKIKSHHS